MKKSYSFAIAAIFAALMSIPSCSYLEEPGKNENTGKEPGTRTVNLCFPQTKTTLDGYQPVWSAGDKILLADGSAQETYEVTAADAGKAQLTITTNLTGAITAVYPSSAAVLEGEGIIGVKVSESQDGSFAKANICLAKEESSNLMFKNQTAVIKVKVPTGTTKLTVTSLGKIGEDGQRGTEAQDTVSINDAGSAPDCNVTTVSGDNAFDGDSCFVSILVDEEKDLYLTDLNFDVEYVVDDTTHYAQGGFSPLSIKAAGVAYPYTYKVKKNDLHTLAASSLHEYITVGEGDNARKWATMNVGALKPEEYGGYYQWAGTDDVTSTSIELGWDNCPYHTGSVEATGWTKYIPSGKKSYWSGSGNPDNKTVLGLEDDVAYVMLGGNWRMPTFDEWDELTESCDWNWTQQNDVNGYKVTINMDKFIFLPAAGCRRVKDLAEANACRYWSSLLFEDTPSQVANVYFTEKVITAYYSDRHLGMPIRPVSK